MEWLDNLGRDYTPMKESFNGDDLAFALNIVGGGLIGLCFLLIGIVCLKYAGRAAVEPGARQRKLFSQMSGVALILCSLSRTIDVFSYWHHVPYLGGIIKIATGVAALITVFHLPSIVRAVTKVIILNDVSKKLDETKDRVDKFEEESKKITGG